MAKNLCAASELDIFQRPPYQSSILSYRWVEYYPSTRLDSNTSEIRVEIPKSDTEYIDTSNIFMYMRLAIKKQDGAVLKSIKTEKIAPINYISNTIFKKIDVLMGQNSQSMTMELEYGYRAEIEAHLNFPNDSKETILEPALWLEDTYGHLDNLLFEEPITTSSTSPGSTKVSTETITPNPGDSVYQRRTPRKYNAGMALRGRRFENASVELFARPHLDICNTNKLLLSGIPLLFIFTKNKNEFCLLGTSGYRIEIEEFQLCVRKVLVSDEVRLAHEKVLLSKSAFYPLTKVNCISRTINQGASSEMFENLVVGALPKRIIIGMVESTAFYGSFSKNPFNFKLFDLTDLSVSIDGVNAPYPPFEISTDPSRTSILKTYYTLFNPIESGRIHSNSVRLHDYINGYGLIALDMSQDGCINTDHFNFEKQGNLRIQFRFKTSLEQAISVIFYFEYESYFEINSIKQVFTPTYK